LVFLKPVISSFVQQRCFADTYIMINQRIAHGLGEATADSLVKVSLAISSMAVDIGGMTSE
jgi:hypothetical protein